MTPGSVFFDRDFHFHDGVSGEKLFVVLGFKDGVVVVAKTTSKQHGRGNVYGCQPEDRFPNFHLPLHTCYLKKTTWVCLDVYYELNASEALQKKFSGVISGLFTLDAAILKELQECAVDSLDISDTQEAIVRASMG